MITQLEAIYENGVFRPLEPVNLPEHERVTVTVQTRTERLPATYPPNGETPPSLEEVRRILAKTKTPLAEAVRTEREER